MSNKYGILAFPAKHSLSPAMHNAAFKNLGIDAKYEVFEIPEHAFKDFMKKLGKSDINGLSVSLPYKERVLEFIDFVDENAKKIGAVNTILNDNGTIKGFNTDYLGAVRAIKNGGAGFGGNSGLNGENVVVVGAGGASRAIIYGLLMEKANITILNRHVERAKEIANDFHYIFNTEIKCMALDKKMEIGASGLLVQATSIWTLNSVVNEEELESMFPDEFVNKFDAVMDIATLGIATGADTRTPLTMVPLIKTPLIQKAERLGKKTITGDRMLLFQALEQFKIFTGKEAPLEVMNSALSSGLYSV